MKAARKILLLVTVLLISSIIISDLYTAAVAINLENENPPSTNPNQSASASFSVRAGSEKVRVSKHRITAAELEAIEGKIGVYDEGENYNEIVAGHGTGLRPPTAAEWQEVSEGAFVVDSVSYPSSPSSVDNSELPWFPPIGNQDGEGSCVAWSVGYYTKTFQEAKERGWNLSSAAWTGGYSGYPTPSYQDKIMSPDFIYHLINNGVDNGASFQDAMNLVCSIGASSWARMPYDRLNSTRWPSEEAWREAPMYRGNASGYEYMSVDTDSGLENLKNWIASEHLATIGVNASYYSGLTSGDVWTLDNYGLTGVNHANTIVGYDDNISYTENGTTVNGAFKVANSWGVGGSWEKVPDGFFWISYEAMKQRIGDCMFYHDMIGYMPELTAAFSVNHDKRDECQIVVGLGSPSSPITTKSFSQYISGGSVPFPANNIVLDITEFKNYVPSFYNQSYFLRVRDVGTSTLGNVTYFAIGNTSSPEAPRETVHNSYVYLTLTYTFVTPELAVSPTSGPGGYAITLNGSAFTASNSVNLSFLNPVNSQWVSIVNNTATTPSGQFTYNLNAPDLMRNNPAGDAPPLSDTVVFRAQDNGSGFSCNTTAPYTEWRRGLTQMGNAVATGLYGNNTDLTSTVLVEPGQPLVVTGRWFNPGDVTVLWDAATVVSTALADETGFLNTTITVPATSAGTHSIVIRDENAGFNVAVTRMPTTTNDYDGLWRSVDFTITLISDPTSAEIYYRVNGGPILNVGINGQPRISSEGGTNTIEYWSVAGVGNEEFPHKTLTQIKLDKTAPAGSVQINGGASYTASNAVRLTLTATDAVSGVFQVRFSNDGLWDTEPWETPSPTREWTLTAGEGEKTVFYQIMDNVGFTSSFSDSVFVDVTRPVANAGQDRTVTAGAPVTLDADSSTDNSGIASYSWDFGDGTTGTGRTVTHTYTDSGTYTATLSVQDAAGNTAISSVTLTVESPAIPEFPPFVAIPLMLILMLMFVVIKKKTLRFSDDRKQPIGT